MHICTHIHINTHTNAYTHMYVPESTPQAQPETSILIHLYTYTHIFTYTCIHTWKYTPSAARAQPAYSSVIVSSASSVSHFILFAYLCKCVTRLIHVWHDSLMCAMTRWCVRAPLHHVRHDSLVFIHIHRRLLATSAGHFMICIRM